MKTFLLVAAVLLVLHVSPANARNLSSVDGNKLLKNCHVAIRMEEEVSPKLSGEEWSAGSYCLGFIQGVMVADSIWQPPKTPALSPKARPGFLMCYRVPKDASWPQLVRVLVKWLEDNPDKLNLSGYGVIQIAMSESYPCAASAP
jgi:Rap1a immunity proteins